MYYYSSEITFSAINLGYGFTEDHSDPTTPLFLTAEQPVNAPLLSENLRPAVIVLFNSKTVYV